LNPIFVDAGFIIALLNSKDNYHQKANRLSLNYEGVPVLTTDAVLLEVGNALSRSAKLQACEIIRYFQNSEDAKIEPLTPALFEQGLPALSKISGQILGPDRLHFFHSHA